MNITTAKEIVAQFESKGWAIEITEDSNEKFSVFISNSNNIKWYETLDTYYVHVYHSDYSNRFRTLISAHLYGKAVKITQSDFKRHARLADNYSVKVGA